MIPFLIIVSNIVIVTLIITQNSTDVREKFKTHWDAGVETILSPINALLILLSRKFKRRWEAGVEKVLAPINASIIFLNEKIFNPMGIFIAYTIWEKVDGFLKGTLSESEDEDNLIS